MYMNNKKEMNFDIREYDDEAVQYVEKYGAYMDIQNSLVYVTYLRAESVFQSLIGIAKFDSHHIESMKLLSQISSPILYEPQMFSAVVERLPLILQIKWKEENIFQFLTSAYHDIKPWLVRRISFYSTQKYSNNYDFFSCYEQCDITFYYEYLCSLLDTVKGDEIARNNPELVNEWCTLSTSNYIRLGKEVSTENFVRVASKQLNQCKHYVRNLPFLIDLSVNIDYRSLIFELAKEIIDSEIINDKTTFLHILRHLRMVGVKAIGSLSNDIQNRIDFYTLQEIFFLFDKMSLFRFSPNSQILDISDEVIRLLKYCSNSESYVTSRNSETYNKQNIYISQKEKIFVPFISNIVHSDIILSSLSKWKKSIYVPSLVFRSLRICLITGFNCGKRFQTSYALSHLRQSTLIEVKGSKFLKRFWTLDVSNTPGMSFDANHKVRGGNIWNLVVNGEACIEK